MKESCGLTLARKFKLKTLKKVFDKFGKDLGSSVNEDTRISRYKGKIVSIEQVKSKDKNAKL